MIVVNFFLFIVPRRPLHLCLNVQVKKKSKVHQSQEARCIVTGITNKRHLVKAEFESKNMNVWYDQWAL